MMHEAAEQIIGLYQRHADAWSELRGTRLAMEEAWLTRFLELAGPSADILDIGCGPGQPIAAWLIAQGCALTGIDSSSRMIDKCRAISPAHIWIVCDMRQLALPRRYAGLLAWDSFFHLSPDHQRAMFPIFAQHAEPGAALMFTSGPAAGHVIGELEGEPLYHASLSEEDYRKCLDETSFDVIAHQSEDETCGGHTVWLARAR